MCLDLPTRRCHRIATRVSRAAATPCFRPAAVAAGPFVALFPVAFRPAITGGINLVLLNLPPHQWVPRASAPDGSCLVRIQRHLACCACSANATESRHSAKAIQPSGTETNGTFIFVKKSSTSSLACSGFWHSQKSAEARIRL